MKRLLIIAAVLVIITNAFIFARVAYNRGGELRTITLTERELSVPYNYFRDKSENSGLSFYIKWQTAAEDVTDYFYSSNRSLEVGPEKLKALGFSVPEDCGGIKVSRGGRDKSRKLWVVLEYDGPAYARDVETLEKHLARRTREIGSVEAEKEQHELKRIEERLQAVKEYESRLYLVDVAPDKDKLWKLYGADPRNLIFAADVGNGSYCNNVQWELKIYISELLPSRINIPRRFHAALENLTGLESRDANHPPRYSATIAMGKLSEPWLLEVIE
jgi:hypothetical protein